MSVISAKWEVGLTKSVMSKPSPKRKFPRKKFDNTKSYLARISYMALLLILSWLAAIIWIIYGETQSGRNTVLGTVGGLLGFLLLQTALLTVFGLLEILFQKIIGWPLLSTRSITGGKGVKGLTEFCVAATYAMTLILSFAELSRYF